VIADVWRGELAKSHLAPRQSSCAAMDMDDRPIYNPVE
jgi:hypothetical protein